MDRRISCICSKSADGNTILRHRVLYILEHESKTKQASVIVRASEMTNPADENELKTKADAKAAEMKAAWVSQLSAPHEQHDTDTSIAGDVTL